jgi:DNA-binding winged helix-turn-helix (wHTH) protein
MSTQLTPIVPGERGISVPETSGFPARYARFGKFQVDLKRGELYQDNQHVKMQMQVYRALLLLLSRAGDIVSREEVRKWLWPEAFMANLDANVNTTMNKLRQVLGDSPEIPYYIETMPRRGYSFIAAVEFSDRPEMRPAAAENEASEATVRKILSASLPRRFAAMLRMAGVLMAGVLLGALLMFVWFFAQAKNHRAVQSGRPTAGASRLVFHAGNIRA